MVQDESDFVPVCHKLTREEEERLVQRLHDQSMARKQETLRVLDARFYPVMRQKTLPKEHIESSITRQVDHEMAKRRAAREEREERARMATLTTKVSAEVVESSTERLYTESIQRKKANIEESRKRYLHTGPPVIQKKQSEILCHVAKLAVPKKREFTIEEVNKIYGLDAGAVGNAGAAAEVEASKSEA